MTQGTQSEDAQSDEEFQNDANQAFTEADLSALAEILGLSEGEIPIINENGIYEGRYTTANGQNARTYRPGEPVPAVDVRKTLNAKQVVGHTENASPEPIPSGTGFRQVDGQVYDPELVDVPNYGAEPVLDPNAGIQVKPTANQEI